MTGNRTVATDDRAAAPVGSRIRWGRPVVNMSGVERLLRLLAGVLLAVAGAWVLDDRVQGVGAVAVWTLLGIGVADLVLSGLLGYCPLYRYLRAPGTGRDTR